MITPKVNAINLGCGNRFHEDWYNIDIKSINILVQEYNLLNDIPYEDNKFSAVYLSHFLEHLTKKDGEHLLSESFRILAPNGIIRVVVPDLENIINEYQYWLSECLKQKKELSEANYDWIMIELFDQVVRNKRGGEMFEYINDPKLINQKYVLDRAGFVASSILNSELKNLKINNSITIFSKIFKRVHKILLKLFLNKRSQKFLEIGEFRTSGEVHYNMYDRFSLKRVLEKVGFKDIRLMLPSESQIINWHIYQLDEKDGIVFSPNSLIMEGKK